MGKYHPHGDTAIYDALVRMAQPFTMRLPLVDGHGNFGSLDDGPAASRYTEARLAPAALLMTAGLDEDTVDFVPNYDDQLLQPGVLPAAFPNLLVNGASGIAVGMATNMAPHNLVEVIGAARHLIANPDCSLDDLMKFVPGPDLPARRPDRRPRRHPRRLPQRPGQLPHPRHHPHREAHPAPDRASSSPSCPTSSAPRRSSRRSRRSSSPRSSRASRDVKDLTDRKHGLRLVIEVKNGFNPEAVLEQLYKLTPMEDSFGINNVALVDGQPQTLGLKELLRVYVDFRIDVVRRRTEYRLRKAQGPAAPRRGPAHRDPRHRRGHPGHPHLRRHGDRPGPADRASSTSPRPRPTTSSSCSCAGSPSSPASSSRPSATSSPAQIEELEAILGDEKLLHKTVSTELADVAKAHGTPRRTVLLESAGTPASVATPPRGHRRPVLGAALLDRAAGPHRHGRPAARRGRPRPSTTPSSAPCAPPPEASSAS